MQEKIIVVIPARGGSKRFPGKNIYPLNGKPLISYPIQAAKASKLVDRVIVSTDDEEIAKVARKFGAEIPFMRPSDLATDNSAVVETMTHLVLELQKREGYKADYAVLLQAATPLVETEQIDSVIRLAIDKNADSVVTVGQVNTVNHPYNIRTIKDDGTMKFWQEDLHYEYLTKEKEKFYFPANIWLSSFNTLVNHKKLEGEKNYPFIVKPIYGLDIDYKEDLELIEAWMVYKKNKFLN